MTAAFEVEVSFGDGRWLRGFTPQEQVSEAEALGRRLAVSYDDVKDVRVVQAGVQVRWLCPFCGTWQGEDPERVECGECRRLC
jgi:hypothetical protein